MWTSGNTNSHNNPLKVARGSTKDTMCNETQKKRYIWLAVCIISLSQLSFGMKYRYLSFPVNENTRKEEDTYRYEDDDDRSGEKYAVFYHAYINPENVTYSLGIVEEQLAQWQESRYAGVTLYYTQLGDTSSSFPCPSDGNCKLLTKNSNGWERDTLVKLSKYCQQYLDRNVIYLHSKGSFHPHEDNDRLRKLLTSSALSDQCNQGLNSTQCNICSARFSPLPHWHTPGNMWTAKCSYVEKLYPVLEFDARVTEIAGNYTPDVNKLPASWFGIDRFADEHWVHTHPQVYPCDVYPDLQWGWGYNLPNIDLPLELYDKAPRNFEIPKKMGRYVRLPYRLYELWHIYNATPANDSFVWTWYKRNKLS